MLGQSASGASLCYNAAMDLATFRRLTPQALQGRLDEELQLEWEQARDQDPEAAAFCTAYALEHDQRTRRLERAVSQRLQPALESPRTVIVPRYWVFMVVGACVVGATVAAAIMISILGPRIAERARASATPRITPGVNAPEVAANNAPRIPALPESSPQPKANRPPEPPPRDPPPVDKPAAQTPVGVVESLRDGAFRCRSRGQSTWSEGQEGTKLFAGDRLRVSRGSLVLRAAETRVTCREGAEIELAKDWANAGFTLHGGQALFARSEGPSVTLHFGQGVLRFGEAAFALQAELGTSELSLVSGRLQIEHVSGLNELAAPAFVLIGTRISVQALETSKAAMLEAELLGPRRTHLAWDFESGDLPCPSGRRVTPGFKDSRGALGSSLEFAWLGGESAQRFRPTPSARLRFAFRTNAPVVRVSFVAGLGAQAQNWSASIQVKAPGQWQQVDLALAEFVRTDKGIQTWQGRECHSLQFRMRFDERSPVMPSERELQIDDVEVYSQS